MIHKKMIIVGNSAVGKTSIMERFVNDTFEEQILPTYQASQRAKIIQLSETNDKIKLNIWDTAGQEKHRSVTRMFY
jgi:small GTP-binding protein